MSEQLPGGFRTGGVKPIDSAKVYTHALVQKYHPGTVEYVRNKLGILEPQSADFAVLDVEPDEETEGEQPGNLLTTVGLAQLTSRLQTAEQAWDNTHVGLAVGNSTQAAVVGDTDLVGASKRYNAMEASYPTNTNGAQDFRASFASGEANFAWEEYGVIVPDTGTAFAAGTSKPASYVLFNRKVTSLGTKVSGAVWVFTVTITIS
jgi:hypothetical protein